MFSILGASMQLGLFDQLPARYGFGRCQRLVLTGSSTPAWLDYCPGFLTGQAQVFEELRRNVSWKHERRQMYDRVVDVPRLMGGVPQGSPTERLLQQLGERLSQRYSRTLASISLAYYRDGKDSVAPHGDKMGPLIPDTVIAILSLGEPRRFVLSPAGKHTREETRVFHLGSGDLLVMGGSCQQTHVHGVPKVRAAGPRISVQFRECLPTLARVSRRPYSRQSVVDTPPRKRLG